MFVFGDVRIFPRVPRGRGKLVRGDVHQLDRVASCVKTAADRDLARSTSLKLLLSHV